MPDPLETNLRDLIARTLGIDVGKIEETSSFADDLGADTLDIVELSMAVEDEFNILITDGEMVRAITQGSFSTLHELVRAKVAAKGGSVAA